MRRRAPVLALVALLLAGGALRAERAAGPHLPPYADEVSYVEGALQLVRRHEYRQTHYPPATSLLFAAAHVAGGRPRTGGPGLPAAYWAQALVATALIAATYALAALIATPWAGVAAAAVVAFHRPFLFRAGKLLSEPLAALLLVLALAALAWALREARPSSRRLALSGALFGALLMTRANFLPVPLALAALLAWVVGRRHGCRRAAGAMAAFLLPAFVLVLPWCLYASQQTGRFVPLATGGGSSLFVGTFLPGGGSTYGAKRVLAAEVRRRHPGRRGTAPTKLPARLVLAGVAARHPGLSRDAALTLEARRNIARYTSRRPAAFARLLLSKVPRLWWRYSEGLRRREPAWAAAVHHALLIISAGLLGAGLVVTRRPALVAAALVLGAVTAEHLLLLALPRYGFPLLPVLYAGAAASAALLLERQRSER